MFLLMVKMYAPFSYTYSVQSVYENSIVWQQLGLRFSVRGFGCALFYFHF